MSSKGEMDRVPATAIPTLENSGRQLYLKDSSLDPYMLGP